MTVKAKLTKDGQSCLNFLNDVPYILKENKEVPKWQYQREEFLQQEEIKEDPAFGKWTHRSLQNAQNAANIQDHTECVKPAVTITADRL